MVSFFALGLLFFLAPISCSLLGETLSPYQGKQETNCTTYWQAELDAPCSAQLEDSCQEQSFEDFFESKKVEIPTINITEADFFNRLDGHLTELDSSLKGTIKKIDSFIQERMKRLNKPGKTKNTNAPIFQYIIYLEYLKSHLQTKIEILDDIVKNGITLELSSKISSFEEKLSLNGLTFDQIVKKLRKLPFSGMYGKDARPCKRFNFTYLFNVLCLIAKTDPLVRKLIKEYRLQKVFESSGDAKLNTEALEIMQEEIMKILSGK